MKKRLVIYAVILGLLAIGFGWHRLTERHHAPQVVSRTESGDGNATLTLLSSTYKVDRIYESMQGPNGPHRGLRLLDTPTPELVWVTGVSSEIVGTDGRTPKSPEFFCHANLTLDEETSDPETHNAYFGDTTHLDWRLFTLVPGRMDISLPSGFGVPMLSSEQLDFYTMSLNLNVTDRTETVRVKTSVALVRDQLASSRLTPLFRRAIYGWEPLAEGEQMPACQVGTHPGESCGEFKGLSASAAGTNTLAGKRTIHWYLPPGPYQARRDVTEQINLPFDSTVHYVTAHLHPYGESVILRDTTLNIDLFEIHSTDFETRRGVKHMEELALPQGVEIYRDHDYELITTYDNTSGELSDAMSIMYLYVHDREFKPPVSAGARLVG